MIEKQREVSSQQLAAERRARDGGISLLGSPSLLIYCLTEESFKTILFAISTKMSLWIVNFWKRRLRTFVVKQTIQSDISSLFPPASSRYSTTRNLSPFGDHGLLSDPFWDAGFLSVK